jgi:D-inositol-3-phosphate glycosyltransferase
MQRVAMLSVHTSPLAQPGTGDGGGMNVYVRALASALARAGVAVDVLTRAEHPEQPPCIDVEPGFRVLHVPAGPCAPVPLRELPELVGNFTDAARELMTRGDDYDVLHANYWVSGAIGHRLKHALDLPLVSTFHTLERVKAEVGLGDASAVPLRPRVEAEVVRCADLARIEVIAPGVDHTVFFPGDRIAARRNVGLGTEPVILFVGRIQPLKGADLAVRALADVSDHRTQLVVVGGPSGPDGPSELAALRSLVAELGLEHRVRFVSPRPHDQLADFYRAADVCMVPSRSESFGLVALEAAACGTPVVAADVGGLRLLVDHGVTGYLVDEREPAAYAAQLDRVLHDTGGDMRSHAVARSTRYRWSIAAARLRRHYDDLTARATVKCS